MSLTDTPSRGALATRHEFGLGGAALSIGTSVDQHRRLNEICCEMHADAAEILDEQWGEAGAEAAMTIYVPVYSPSGELRLLYAAAGALGTVRTHMPLCRTLEMDAFVSGAARIVPHGEDGGARLLEIRNDYSDPASRRPADWARRLRGIGGGTEAGGGCA